MELDIIRTIVSEVLKVDPREVEYNTTFVEDLGADSLDIMRIVMGIEDKFSIMLPKDTIYKIATIDDVISVIKKIKKA